MRSHLGQPDSWSRLGGWEATPTKDSHFIKNTKTQGPQRCSFLHGPNPHPSLFCPGGLLWDFLSSGGQGVGPINKCNLFWFLVSGLEIT